MNNTLIRIYKYLTLHVTSTQFSILCSNKSKKTLRKENSTLVKVRKKVKVEAGGCLTLGLHTVLYFFFSSCGSVEAMDGVGKNISSVHIVNIYQDKLLITFPIPNRCI